jgi:hypothetical protein
MSGELHIGQRVFCPRLYAHQEDKVATVVDVRSATRQLWVRFDGEEKVREISTFQVRAMAPGVSAPVNR